MTLASYLIGGVLLAGEVLIARHRWFGWLCVAVGLPGVVWLNVVAHLPGLVPLNVFSFFNALYASAQWRKHGKA